MELFVKSKSVVVWFFSLALVLTSAQAHAQGVAVFNSIPEPMPGNVPSLGFQATSAAEFGDMVKLPPGTPRRAASATVLMSDWAKHSDYPSMPAAGFSHPLTLAIYADAASAASRMPLASVTQTFLIPWRPEADPTCAGGGWRFSPTQCFSGMAFKVTFDLRPLNLDLPEEFIFGVAYNTNTSGYSPLYVGGPYESLNVGLANVNGAGVPPSVGTDVDPDVIFWNTEYAGFYSDGGAGGVGIFRPTTDWLGYQPAVQFMAAATPRSKRDCKDGGWRELVRADWRPFKNEGACVAYVEKRKHHHKGKHDDRHDDDDDDRGHDKHDKRKHGK